jgi:hypothetical protein
MLASRCGKLMQRLRIRERPTEYALFISFAPVELEPTGIKMQIGPDPIEDLRGPNMYLSGK